MAKGKQAKGEHKKANRPKQEGYEIVLDSGGDKVKQVWVRFGTLDGNGNHNWVRTMAMERVEINPGKRKTVAIVDDDQLPAAANCCYYQLLCEIDNKQGPPETLMTEPTLLA